MPTRITPERSRVNPTGPQPEFIIRTNREHFVVEATIDPILFQGALAGRRTATNFYQSAVEDVGGRARVEHTLDAGAWASFRSFPYIYYRVRGFNNTAAAPRRVQLSTTDTDFRRAPSIFLVPAAFSFPRVPRGISGNLIWLRVEGNRVVNEAGDTVVLRGVNRSGMEYSDRNGLDPTGVRRPTSREVAGITQAEIQEIARHWRSNIIRLPINQEWVLTRADYLTNLDRIIEWAAAEGMYTLLDLQWFDNRREFGHNQDGSVNRVPPMPEENTVRVWHHLAARYRSQPAVLYDIFNEPHVPLADDTTFLFQRPATEAEWLNMWHNWVRRIETAIHRVNPRALIFVSGWNWGLNLRSFPVPGRAARPLPNIVYSTHVYFSTAVDTKTDTVVDQIHWFGFPRLRLSHPIFVGEWGGTDANIAWGDVLETHLRSLHRYVNGIWHGLAGWTAWSWADAPLLVQRQNEQREDPPGTMLRWRSFVMDGAHNRPTEFGELVRGALRVQADALDSDFVPAAAFGSRSPYRITASVARRNDFFLVYGHDFTPGTRIEITSGGVVHAIDPRGITPRVLVVPQLDPAIAAGAATCRVRRPDGLLSEPVNINITTDALPDDRVLLNGATKVRPYSILIMANPVIENPAGIFVADPIQTRRNLFHDVVADVVEALFGYAESFLHPYFNEIRVLTRFRAAAGALASVFCHPVPRTTTMEPMRDRIRTYLAAAGLAADVALIAYHDPGHNRDSAHYTTDDNASSGRAFRYDGRRRSHRTLATTVGTVALNTPTDDPLTPLHEFMHAFSDSDNGACADLYVNADPGVFAVNKKRRGTVGAAIPRTFARYSADEAGPDVSFGTADDVRQPVRVYLSDRRRDGIGYPAHWRDYHPQLIDQANPNVLDDYYRSAIRIRCRLDILTLRFMRDRLETKLNR